MPEEIKTKLEQEQIDYDQIIEEIKAEEAENKKRQQEQLQENNRILSVGKQHLMKSLQNIIYRYLEINDVYEYDVVSIQDEDNGAVDINRIKSCVNRRALEGWRLVSVTTNRIGTNSSSAGYAGISHGTNAAIDQTIQHAFNNHLALEGKVVKEVKGGYEVTVAGHRGFCPYSQIDRSRRQLPPGAENPYVGKTFSFLVQEYGEDERGANLIVSRRAVQEKELQQAKDYLRDTLAVDQTHNGTVVKAEWYGGYGYCIILDHGNGMQTLYGHMSGFAVGAGDTVSQGDTIGYLGATGVATGTHCHLEVFVNGSRVDPAGYFSGITYYDC